MVITANRLNSYVEHLQRAEHAAGTVDKYRRSILAFAAFLERADAPRYAVLVPQFPTKKTTALRTQNKLLTAAGRR